MLDLERVDPTYHLVFDDGSRLSAGFDLTLRSDTRTEASKAPLVRPNQRAGRRAGHRL